MSNIPCLQITLCAKLGAMGITCDRRTLAKDIAMLNDQGYVIMAVGEESTAEQQKRVFLPAVPD